MRHDLGAVRRMASDGVELLIVELAGLGQDAVRDGDLADVVEEPAEADRVEPLGRHAQLGRDRERDALNSRRVAGGVGILRVDGRVEALDRLQRALLETAIGVHQLARTGAQRDRLALHGRRGVAHEQRQRGVQRREDRDDRNPDDTLARGDEALGALGLGVDLVRTQRAHAVRAHDRGVDLEHVAKPERTFRDVLVVPELVDGCVSALECDRLPEVAGEGGRKAPADPFRSSVRPDQRPVRTPDLDGDEIGLPPKLRLELPGEVRGDVQLVVAHKLGTQHAVHVLGQAHSRIVERLPLDGGRQQPAEDDRPDEQDAGASQQEDTQKRDRAVKRPAA